MAQLSVVYGSYRKARLTSRWSGRASVTSPFESGNVILMLCKSRHAARISAARHRGRGAVLLSGSRAPFSSSVRQCSDLRGCKVRALRPGLALLCGGSREEFRAAATFSHLSWQPRISGRVKLNTRAFRHARRAVRKPQKLFSCAGVGVILTRASFSALHTATCGGAASVPPARRKLWAERSATQVVLRSEILALPNQSLQRTRVRGFVS